MSFLPMLGNTPLEGNRREPVRDENIPKVIRDAGKLEYLTSTPVDRNFVRAFSSLPNSSFPFPTLLQLYIKWAQQYLKSELF